MIIASRYLNGKVYITNVDSGKSSANSLDNLINIKNMMGGLIISLFVPANMVWGSGVNIPFLSHLRNKPLDALIWIRQIENEHWRRIKWSTMIFAAIFMMARVDFYLLLSIFLSVWWLFQIFFLSIWHIISRFVAIRAHI